MSTTLHVQLYDAVVAALQAGPAVAGGNIKTLRDTKRPMPLEVPAQLRVCLDQSIPQYLIGGPVPVDWTTRIRIECLARDVLQPTLVTAFDAVSALAATVQARVLADTALRALVMEVQPAPMQWTDDEADTALVACQCLFTLVHRTPFSNLIV